MKRLIGFVLAAGFWASPAHAVDITISVTAAQAQKLSQAKDVFEAERNITVSNERFIKEVLREYVFRKLVKQTEISANDTKNATIAAKKAEVEGEYPDSTKDCNIQNSGFCYRGDCAPGSQCVEDAGACVCQSTPTTTLAP